LGKKREKCVLLSFRVCVPEYVWVVFIKENEQQKEKMQKEKWGKDDKGKIWSGETLTQRKKKERNEHLLEKDN
jgi:hypothetical protein